MVATEACWENAQLVVTVMVVFSDPPVAGIVTVKVCVLASLTVTIEASLVMREVIKLALAVTVTVEGSTMLLADTVTVETSRSIEQLPATVTVEAS